MKKKRKICFDQFLVLLPWALACLTPGKYVRKRTEAHHKPGKNTVTD